MKNCWASEYFSCDGKISREHYISYSVFEQQSIYVSGFSWCKDKGKEIGRLNLTAKVLCEHHNNCLSFVDQAGVNAIRIFEQLLPAKYRSNSIPPRQNVIDGLNFERWLLKIAINLSYKSELHIGVGMTDSVPGAPSPYLLQVVFGKLPFTHKLGRYTLSYETFERFRVGSISFTPIHKDKKIGGFLFHIRGLDFFLSLYPGHAVPKLNTVGIGNDGKVPKHIASAIPEYRKKVINVLNEHGERYDIHFDWRNETAVSSDPKYHLPPE